MSRSHEMQLLLGNAVLAEAAAQGWQKSHLRFTLKLKSGDVIQFRTARLENSEWLHLGDVSGIFEPLNDSVQSYMRSPFSPDNGIDVRIAEIVWVIFEEKDTP